MELWREKALQMEQDKQIIEERSKIEKQELADQLIRNHSAEKELLENRISTLKQSLISTENNYIESNIKLKAKEEENIQLHQRASLLQDDIHNLQKQKQIQEEVYESQIHAKEQMHQSQIMKVQQNFEEQQSRLKNEMDTLNLIINDKMQESREVRLQALQQSEKKKQAEIEAEIWRKKCSEQERLNHFERISNERQLENIHRSHSKEIEMQEREKQELKKSLIIKDEEVQNERIGQVHLRREINSLSLEAQKNKEEAENWQKEARVIEELKNSEILARERQNRRQVEQMRQSYGKDIHMANEEIMGWRNIAYNRQQEANDWFRNYNRLYQHAILNPPSVYKTYTFNH